VGDTLRQGPEGQPEYFTLTLVRQKDTGITENIEENQNENERSENEDNTTIREETKNQQQKHSLHKRLRAPCK